MTNKPKLVLLSGLLCSDFVWQPVAQQLKPIADPLILHFAGQDSITAMAQQVLSTCPQGFSLAGHSMGGRVALEVFRLAPERVDRLALLNTGVHPQREGEVNGRQKLVSVAETKGMAALAEAWLPPMVGPSKRSNKLLMSSLSTMVRNHSLSDYKKQIKALLNRPDAESLLPLINVPTLLLSGTEDKWSPVPQHAQMQQAIPGSKLLALDDTGHMSTVESPALVAKALKEWLQWTQS